MRIDFLSGHPLFPEELEMIRQKIEKGFDTSPKSMTRYAASSLATGFTCSRSCRRKKTNRSPSEVRFPAVIP